MASLGVPQSDIDALVRTIRTGQFLNKQLTSICNANGLKGGGVKMELQNRIIAYINSQAHDLVQFQRIRQSIQDVQKSRGGHQALNAYGAVSGFAGDQASTALSYPSSGYYSQAPSASGPYRSSQSAYAGSQRAQMSSPGHRNTTMLEPLGIQFTPSPFYRVVSRLGEIRTLEEMPNHRSTVELSVKAHDNSLLPQCCLENSKMRVMLLCASGTTGVQNVAFPQNSELKVNGGELKANMRGLKNKPGTTRPVDVTSSLRLKPPTFRNSVSFTYALTSQKFYLALCICEMTSSKELVSGLGMRAKISIAYTVAELRKKAEDPDIEATSSKLSLKCPIGFRRLETPCRAQSCKHIACFDALSYLLLQEQAAQWKCPICNNAAAYENLAIDMYVKDILEKTPEDEDQVIIEPDGQWHAESEPHDKLSGQSWKPAKLEDDNDVIPIPDDTPYAPPYTPARSLDTPSFVASRESSIVSRQRSRSNLPTKRQHEVIDLTLDSDDDEPPRPTKRSLYNFHPKPTNGNPAPY